MAMAIEAIPAPFPIRVQLPTPSHSWFLGAPALPAETQWPAYEGRPLGFLACLDLAEMRAVLPIEWLPGTGTLSFFYDLEGQPWGFDPKDRGRWAVIHSLAPERPVAPPGSRRVEFRRLQTYPHHTRAEIQQLALTAEERELYWDIHAARNGKGPGHQIGGFPSIVQNDDLEVVSELASGGTYCGDGISTERGKELAPDAREWRLLLQLTSDETVDFMWGDAGNLYFMIKESDARAGRFERTWLQLQCH